MARSEERRRILDLLALGSITVDQATELLKALGPTQAETLPLPPVALVEPAVRRPPEPTREPRPRSSKPRFIRINVNAEREGAAKPTKVNINVPIALAKFALRFVPGDAKAEMSAQGIDIAQLLEGLDSDFPEGTVLDLHADEGDGKGTAHITIEVI